MAPKTNDLLLASVKLCRCQLGSYDDVVLSAEVLLLVSQCMRDPFHFTVMKAASLKVQRY